MFFFKYPEQRTKPDFDKNWVKASCENTADYQILEYREMTLIYDAKIFRITGCIQLKP